MLVPHGWRAQEYLPGTAISLTFLADGQRIIDAFWTRSWATDNDFRYRGGVIDGHLYIPRRQAAEDMAQDLVSTWGLAGWNGLDFLATENALYALELNPRWTGSVELWESVTCQSAFETLVRVMTGSPTTRPARLIPSAGKRIVRAVQRCRWGENWPRIEGGTLADIPWPGQTFQVGQPVCTLVMAGPSAEWVTSHLLAWEEQILTWLHLTSSVPHRGGLP
jgi:predicted ATP-grasp superfamily ATP-dependent carboligase